MKSWSEWFVHRADDRRRELMRPMGFAHPQVDRSAKRQDPERGLIGDESHGREAMRRNT